MAGQPAELVARCLRGDPGSQVDLLVRHLGKVDASSGQAGKGGAARLTLTRAAVKVSPVEAAQVTVATTARGGGGGGSSSVGSVVVGVITVPSFSQETGGQLVEALRQVKPGSAALAVDLRGNAGGFMPAGVDAAKLFLPSGAKVISEVARDGSAQVFLADGVGAETQTPLYLLVDSRTASAAEIMAVALQDNNRATLVGGSAKTFGKGRIQNVQQLADGSGVAVTKAKYLSPTGRDIHGVGITPNVVNVAGCAPASPAEACLAGVL
jgi:carboxyl-terminal processing protease